MAKVKCRPVRTVKKPGPKTVHVKSHPRSKPKPISKKCYLLTSTFYWRRVSPFCFLVADLLGLRRRFKQTFDNLLKGSAFWCVIAL